MFWVAMEMQPQLNERIELMIGLAPVASVAQMKSPIKFLTPYFRQLEVLHSPILNLLQFAIQNA